MRRARMECWLALAMIMLDRALTLAIKRGDADTALKIRESVDPWLSYRKADS